MESTLVRGVEIERDFYQLKAQEWAIEPKEAEEVIKAHMREIFQHIQKARKRALP